MRSRQPQGDPIGQKLDAIHRVLQDLFILEGAIAGIKREDLRRILSLDNNRISRVMKHVRRTKVTGADG
jgi:hypothetical protein